MTIAETEALWARIVCPTLLVYGRESRASNPPTDGRVRHFRHVEVASIEGAGHWVHHDRLGEFISLVRAFLAC